MWHKIIGLTRDIEPKSERKEPQLIKSPDSISKNKKKKQKPRLIEGKTQLP